ncbi:hypothetical protein AGABI1DRAFT_108633 [Agaricus bisporus var. burnettii JB137-S8]|uniref:WW domain-containing protein n=1 Tax=Agaricus bisporus var. burnettii (strain JB137-S8 / ATCC MYA-4627 / FGSC 10392) TaxID=597362 RepID=K5WN94_AGABU|nr:uncharacterized protein AGABI1DRAFT_108633 [Agaricus bisporus var. burnettii JB137-S8]EKM76801.1 hypothetical protein AGABI1DRAFT_108633 [Agaricus bisporus var. burnettii JB137-S8]
MQRPTYLPPQWSAHVQPEGKPYFSHKGPLTTVTESWIHDAKIISEVEKWIERITLQIKNKKTELINVELYIRIDENLDCYYYVVDRQAQSLFWTENLTTEDVGLPPVASPSHLRAALEKEFWQHVDRFPAHFGGLREENLLQLLDAFSYIRIDQITSCYSTFTHPAEETNAIYDILKGCRGRTHKAEVVSTIARGWNVVLFSRFHNLYGEETPRIDSRHSIYVESEEDREVDGFRTRMMCFMTFKQSEYLRERMNTLFVDQFVYSPRVSDFVQERVREWKEQVVPSLLMLSLHISFFFIHASWMAVAISATCFSFCLMAALALIQQHDRLSSHKDPEHVIDWFHSQVLGKYKFQKVAFIFAAPGAFFTWGMLSFFGHWLFIALSGIDSTITIPLAGILGVVLLLCLLQVTTASEKAPPTPALTHPHSSSLEHEPAGRIVDIV